MKINGSPSGISLHYEKHKGNDTAVNGLQRHNERKPGQKHANKNIKDERTAENVFLRRSPKKYKAEIEDKIKKNKKGGMKGVRKNSVRLVEATVQLSGKILEQPEEKQEEVLQDMYEWLKEEHGEENIVSAVIHKDETNMHLHFDFVPITEDKRLSARDIISKGNMRRMQRESLEYMQEKYKSMNFERGNSETKGLSQKDFETFKKLQEEHEQAMNEYSDMLDVQENELDKREEAVTEKEAELSGKEYKLRNASNTVHKREKNVNESEKNLEMKEKQYQDEYKALQSEKERFNKTLTKFNQQQVKMKQDKEQLGERENDVEGRETAVTVREIQVETKDQEADKKLLEAENERNKAEKLLEQVKGIKNNLARRWEMILDMVRAGELRSREVEEVAEKYDPFTDDKFEDFSQDVLELSKQKKSHGMGL